MTARVSPRDEISRAIKAWVQTVLKLEDNQIVRLQRGATGPRPPRPFLSFTVSIMGIREGTDEKSFKNAGVVRKGVRRGVVSFQAVTDPTDPNAPSAEECA